MVRIQSGYVVRGMEVHRRLLREMLDQSMLAMSGQSTVSGAWRSILRQDDVVGIKFNRSGQETIATTPAVADALIESLTGSGFRPDQIVCIEAPPQTEAKHGTMPAVQGFDAQETDFGSGRDEFASVLGQVTALIDVPFLKTHNIAGMSGAMKNLSHGLIKHPARFHRNGCSPYIADIVASPPIRPKLRLCVVDALRVVYDGGPEATSEGLSDEGLILVSQDPVACDTVGLSEVNRIRRGQGMQGIQAKQAPLSYLAAAHDAGLGVAAWHGIDLVSIAL